MLIYQSKVDTFRIGIHFEDESVWLTQQQMAELFQTIRQNISLHINNIYSESELLPQATVKEYLTVQTEGAREVKRTIDYCNLDMTISVGYRVRSSIYCHPVSYLSDTAPDGIH